MGGSTHEVHMGSDPSQGRLSMAAASAIASSVLSSMMGWVLNELFSKQARNRMRLVSYELQQAVDETTSTLLLHLPLVLPQRSQTAVKAAAKARYH